MAAAAEREYCVGKRCGVRAAAADSPAQQTRRTFVEAYCVKCRAKREMVDAKQVTMKNGKPAVQGKCQVCGTTMNKIGASLEPNRPH